MKILLLVIGGLAVLVILMVAVGALLPAEHRAVSRLVVNAPAEVVWQTLTDVAAFPAWRSDVKKVDELPPVDGRRTWREQGSDGVITYERLSAQEPQRLVTRIADESLPFGGTWSFDLVEVDGRTQVTITEDGVVRNPLFRFMARFVFGHHRTQEQYLKALAARFGAASEPQRLE